VVILKGQYLIRAGSNSVWRVGQEMHWPYQIWISGSTAAAEVAGAIQADGPGGDQAGRPRVETGAERGGDDSRPGVRDL